MNLPIPSLTKAAADSASEPAKLVLSSLLHDLRIQLLDVRQAAERLTRLRARMVGEVPAGLPATTEYAGNDLPDNLFAELQEGVRFAFFLNIWFSVELGVLEASIDPQDRPDASQ